jgi:hypothetical protein
MSTFTVDQQLVKTNPSNEASQNTFTGVKDTLNSFNRDLNPVIKVLQVSGIIPITKTHRGTTVLLPVLHAVMFCQSISPSQGAAEAWVQLHDTACRISGEQSGTAEGSSVVASILLCQ